MSTTNTLAKQKQKSISHAKQVGRPTYLDNHATTAVDPRVLDTMLPFFSEAYGNAASSHMFGVRAAYAVEQARQQVAQAITAQASEIIFTAGATESNNFAIKGVFEYFLATQKTPHFIVTAVEHKCVLEAAKHVERLGAELTILPVTSEGLVEPAALSAALRPNTVLVSAMFANNEIGSINPIRELAALCHEQGVLFHTDGAQILGKVPVDVAALGIDMMSASSHKFYGPKGSGFLYVRESVKQYLTPLMDGGGQESNLRSGTLNIPGIVGTGKALELANDELNTDFWHYVEMRNQLYEALSAAVPSMILNGPAIATIKQLRALGDMTAAAASLQRLPNNLNLTIPGLDITKLRMQVAHLAFSSTSACSSANPEPSYVLKEIGRSNEDAGSSLRFGIGRFNDAAQVTQAADELVAAIIALV